MALVRGKNDTIDAMQRERGKGPILEANLAKQVAKELQAHKRGTTMLTKEIEVFK